MLLMMVAMIGLERGSYSIVAAAARGGEQPAAPSDRGWVALLSAISVRYFSLIREIMSAGCGRHLILLLSDSAVCVSLAESSLLSLAVL